MVEQSVSFANPQPSKFQETVNKDVAQTFHHKLIVSTVPIKITPKERAPRSGIYSTLTKAEAEKI